MSSLSRFAPRVTRSVILQHRYMATAATAHDPVQRLFADKIREFKNSNKGLDDAHQKMMGEEMSRLKRVYQVDDESKIAHYDLKYAKEHDISLHDLDDSKEKRQQIASGEYHRQLQVKPKEPSVLIASIPEQVTHEFHLPPMNKPDRALIYNSTTDCLAVPIQTTEVADYDYTEGVMTPKKLEKSLKVKFGDEMPTIDDDKAPERDAVNFPRLSMPEKPPATRYHLIPESWFQFLYPRTGVTGPYALALGFGSFLFSKEIVAYDHDVMTGMALIVVFSYGITKFGPKVSAYLDQQVDRFNSNWDKWQTNHIKLMDDVQKHYKKELTKDDCFSELYKIRRNDVEVQLETEYRTRLNSIYNTTRRRLNYLVSVADSKRQIFHKNMVNWVISNAISSIGAKQEGEVLDSCIANLKLLSGKHANAI